MLSLALVLVVTAVADAAHSCIKYMGQLGSGIIEFTDLNEVAYARERTNTNILMNRMKHRIALPYLEHLQVQDGYPIRWRKQSTILRIIVRQPVFTPRSRTAKHRKGLEKPQISSEPHFSIRVLDFCHMACKRGYEYAFRPPRF